MAECINIRTIFSMTRVSTFCVEFENAVETLSELLQVLGSEYAQEGVLEVVSNYGKRSVMPGDVTVGVLTIVVGKGLVEYTGARDEGFLRRVGGLCEAKGYKLVLSG
ncbi:MAG: TA0956 family protein [Thermoprotei archaeon]